MGDAVSLKSSLNLLELHDVLQKLSNDVGGHLKGTNSYGNIGEPVAAHLAESAQHDGPHYSPPKTRECRVDSDYVIYSLFTYSTTLWS